MQLYLKRNPLILFIVFCCNNFLGIYKEYLRIRKTDTGSARKREEGGIYKKLFKYDLDDRRTI